MAASRTCGHTQSRTTRSCRCDDHSLRPPPASPADHSDRSSCRTSTPRSESGAPHGRRKGELNHANPGWLRPPFLSASTNLTARRRCAVSCLPERSSHPVYSSSQLSHLSILLLGSPSQRDHAGDELLDDLIDTIDAVVRTGTASSADVLGRLLTPSHRSRSCGGSSPFARLHNAAGAGAIRPLPGPTEIVSRVRRRWRVATETSSHCVRWCGGSL